jgi:hypothetical protein
MRMLVVSVKLLNMTGGAAEQQPSLVRLCLLWPEMHAR